MLPPGHIAAGYLTSYLFLEIVYPPLNSLAIKELLLLGAFFGVLPDLDFFYSFFQNQSLRVGEGKNNHRYFYTHAPIFWLTVGLLIYFLSDSLFFRCLGLLLWLCSWSHFLFDSFDYGIRWLWPWSNKFYAIQNKQVEFQVSGGNFFHYWVNFIWLYAKNSRITFVLELLMIIGATIVYVL
jgi:membrane-bound metal-dependent hydrolase YbcI (DUF457 family)